MPPSPGPFDRLDRLLSDARLTVGRNMQARFGRTAMVNREITRFREGQAEARQAQLTEYLNERNREMRERHWMAAGASMGAGEAAAPIQPAPTDEAQLELNRPTTLLACICMIRLYRPVWGDDLIADYLSRSFPEISITARDVDTLFEATRRNHPDWVADMRRVYDAHQRALAYEMLDLLLRGTLADMPLLPVPPRDIHHDRREGIRYLQDLVGVKEEDRV